MTPPTLPTLPIPAIAAVQISCIVLAGVTATRSRAGRAMALTFALLCCLAACCHEPGASAWRFLAGLTAAMLVVRTINLCNVSVDVPLAHRLAHVFALVDTFRIRRVPKRVDGARLAKAGVFLVVTLAGVACVLLLAPTLEGVPRWIARWGGGLVMAYASSEVAYATLESTWLAFGVAIPTTHVHPAMARSIREFWGSRWNRIVGTWLNVRFYRPLARRGHPALGMVAAFVASAILHAYLMEVALGWEAALVWFGYFALQGIAALVEGPMRVSRWKRPLAHAWVVVIMVATSPLFIEPALRTLWPGAR